VAANADRHASNVLPIIREVQLAGAKSLRAIAKALNARGIPTARGGRWQAMTVSNVLSEGVRMVIARAEDVIPLRDVLARWAYTEALGAHSSTCYDDCQGIEAMRAKQRAGVPFSGLSASYSVLPTFGSLNSSLHTTARRLTQ
jgi:hypothetical protein